MGHEVKNMLWEVPIMAFGGQKDEVGGQCGVGSQYQEVGDQNHGL